MAEWGPRATASNVSYLARHCTCNVELSQSSAYASSLPVLLMTLG